MKRYLTVPRLGRQAGPIKAASCYDPIAEEYAHTADMVFETEEYPESTGLLDAEGNEIYSLNVKDPIGFWLKLSDESV